MAPSPRIFPNRAAALPLDAPIGAVERALLGAGCRYVVGVDEAGRGPLAGPVYAAAVALDLQQLDALWLRQGLDDSKRLTEAHRERLYDLISAHALSFAVAWRGERAIDEHNILQATLQAMGQAVDEALGALPEVARCDWVLIDGNQTLPSRPSMAQHALVKGDGRSLAIAAASILAKVSRDRVMVEHHQRWPEYGFAQHKGYGTRAHREAITTHGPCPVHRLSFGGVREHADRLRGE